MISPTTLSFPCLNECSIVTIVEAMHLPSLFLYSSGKLGILWHRLEYFLIILAINAMLLTLCMMCFLYQSVYLLFHEVTLLRLCQHCLPQGISINDFLSFFVTRCHYSTGIERISILQLILSMHGLKRLF